MMRQPRWALLAAMFVPTGIAEAGNGSNYIHLLNGIDYFFLQAPTNGNLRGVWRCFPADVLHAPTRVVDPTNPEVGNYAAKICAIHMTVQGSPAGPLLFPAISISTSEGTCHFTRSSGTALNFGLVPLPSAGTNVGVVVGPLSGNGVPASNVTTQVVILGASITNPASAPSIAIQLALNLAALPGSPSTIPVPDGDAMTLWHQENTAQTGPGNRMYWYGSLDERNICSGYSFMLSGNGNTALGFNSAWEWSAGIGTLDATMTATITSTGGGATNLNAHAGTAFSQPFDQGSGVRTVSLTGTTPFPATSTNGEFVGFAHYDESNAFGGSDKLVMLNLQGFESTGSATCDDRSPTFVELPTGGPGGPLLSPSLNAPRSVARIDALTINLLSNPVWIAATTHRGLPGGSNIPWFPAGAGISGSTGNTGGFVLPLPPTATLAGVKLYHSAVSLNATGTAIAALANSGHSHTNGGSILFFP